MLDSMPIIGNILHLLFITYWLGLGVHVASAQNDKTLVPGQNGTNVVIAVTEKLDASGVFNYSESRWYRINGQRPLVKQFLRYKAFVETRYGERPSIGQGGIWKVTEEQFNETIVYVTNHDDDLRSKINNSLLLKIDWLSLKYADMSKPMYSGLATILRLDQLLQEETIALLTSFGLAEIWQDHFDGNNIHDWYDGIKELTINLQESKCSIL